jgi:hypothetical protein
MTGRRLPTALAAVLLLMLGAAAAPAGAATARQQLPTGAELGGGWRSRASVDVSLADAKSFSAAQQAYVTSGTRRTYARRTAAGVRERLVIVLWVTHAAPEAGELFGQTAAQFAAGRPLSGLPQFAEGSAGQRYGRAINVIFRQGATFGSVLLERTNRRRSPARATLVTVGQATAAKVAATP